MQIHDDRDSVVSVHTQSMTARSSVRKGTMRKLQTHKETDNKKVRLRNRQSVKGFLVGVCVWVF